MSRITKPQKSEPIRLTEGVRGPRYRVVLDVADPGEPRKQVTKSFKTLRAARDYVDESRVKVRSGAFTPPSAVTFQQLVNDWLVSHRQVREVTRQGYRQVLRPLLNEYGHRPVQTITRAEVDRWIGAMRESGGVRGRGLSHRSIQYTLVSLRQCFSYGVESGVLSRSPAENVKVPRKRIEDAQEVETWTAQELDAFRTIADQDQWAAAWRLTLSGMRRSEVLGLAWDGVDIEQGTVAISQSRVVIGGGETETDAPKSAASRRTLQLDAMYPSSMTLFRTLRAQQAADRLAAGSSWIGSGLVVVNTLGQGIHPDSYGDRFRALCTKAKVPVIRLHAVRHTIASIMHGQGIPPADAAQWLGHSLETHLSVYVKPSAGGSMRAAESFAQVFAANR